MQVDIYFRNIEKVTMQVDIYFRNIKKVTMQVGAGDFHTESPAGAQLLLLFLSSTTHITVSCTATTATTIITTVPLFNHPYYCHGVKEGPALCVFCSTIFTVHPMADCENCGVVVFRATLRFPIFPIFPIRKRKFN